MPSLAELAALCHVSRNTMWKALALLKAQNLLCVQHRGAIVAGPQGAIAQGSIPKGLIWQRLKDAIGHDVLSGTFEKRQLPPITKLAAHYSVSLVTLKKALAQLVDEGIIAASGRHYTILQKHGAAISSLLFISEGTTSGGILALNERIHELAGHFERECPGFSSRLVPIGFDCTDPRELLAISTRLKKAADIMGVVVSMWYPWEETGRSRWLDLIGLLIRLKRPLVIIDQSGDFTPPAWLRDLPLLKILRISGIRAGEIVGDFVLSLKSKAICYVSSNIKTSWAHSRYMGLCRHIEEYGGPTCSVNLCTLTDDIPDATTLVSDLLQMSETDLRCAFGVRYSAEGVERIVSSLALPLRFEWHSASFDQRYRKALVDSFQGLCRLAREGIEADIYNRMFDSWYDRASTFAIHVRLQPFFEETLKNNHASIWVCSDSKTAFAAHLFLKSKGISVPGQIGIVSFDNWSWTLEIDLTTYDFNMNGMARRALALIANKKEFARWPMIREMDGYIVERRTTRR